MQELRGRRQWRISIRARAGGYNLRLKASSSGATLLTLARRSRAAALRSKLLDFLHRVFKRRRPQHYLGNNRASSTGLAGVMESADALSDSVTRRDYAGAAAHGLALLINLLSLLRGSFSGRRGFLVAVLVVFVLLYFAVLHRELFVRIFDRSKVKFRLPATLHSKFPYWRFQLGALR